MNCFTVKDWITIVVAIAVIVGWFVNSWLNRKNEIAKKATEHRMIALGSLLEALYKWKISVENNSPDKELANIMSEAYFKIQIYGKEDEIGCFENFMEQSRTNNEAGIREVYPELITLLRNRHRKELNLQPLNEDKKKK